MQRTVPSSSWMGHTQRKREGGRGRDDHAEGGGGGGACSGGGHPRGEGCSAGCHGGGVARAVGGGCSRAVPLGIAGNGGRWAECPGDLVMSHSARSCWISSPWQCGVSSPPLLLVATPSVSQWPGCWGVVGEHSASALSPSSSTSTSSSSWCSTLTSGKPVPFSVSMPCLASKSPLMA